MTITKRSATYLSVQHLVLAAAIALGHITTALAGHPSEIWDPPASEPWSPRVAALPVEPLPSPEPVPAPATTTTNAATTTTTTTEVFAPPPAEGEPLDGQMSGDGQPYPQPAGPCTGAPGYIGSPECDACQPHSSFMRSLGRFGLVAPPTPGVDSVHSAYVNGPAQWGAPVCNDAIFAPPNEQGALGQDEAAPLGNQGNCCPNVDPRAQLAPYNSGDFSADPFYDQLPYDPCAQADVYGGKYLNPTQRPLIEWGMPLYLGGPVPPPSDRCGPTNPSLPRMYLYGDYRAAAAYNQQNGVDQGVLANRINLEWDLWLTSTERFHVFTGPYQRDNAFQRIVFDDDDAEFFSELDFFDSDTDTAFFEGDLGYMLGGWTGQYAEFDLPITVGLIPLLFQNGVWLDDAFWGCAATIPARNSPWLDWSNYDVTFFAGFDQLTSPAFDNVRSGAQVVGATTFIEAKGGYFEVGYAFLDDTDNAGLSYNNVGVSYTRRYLNLVSNSMRVIANAGQDGPIDDRTAQGVLVLAENSFLTPWPYNVIPYVNMWTGFDDPQSVARAGAAGGVLRNTGILFESDNLTGYPTLDATGNDTYGAAVGLDLLSPEFTHQLIVEAAVLQVFGDPATRNAPGDQYGVGMRYQVPISNASLLRFDVMQGFFVDAPDVAGARAEYRWKF